MLFLPRFGLRHVPGRSDLRRAKDQSILLRYLVEL